MNALCAAEDLPYWLWAAALLLSACLHALPWGGTEIRDGVPPYAAPGFTVEAPQVGQVRVIPLANAELVSPCAAFPAASPPGEQSLAEL